MAERNIAIVVGSLREGSLNRKLAHELVRLAPPGLSFSFVEIGALPLYNQDLDGLPPQAWEDFRAAIRPADAVLFVTPEYNRSIPGVLKNAVDVGSRPYGHSVWAKKPGAIVTVSPGAMGGFGANHHLRQSCVFLDVPIMPQPEAYLGHMGDAFGEDGRVKEERTRGFLTSFMAAFADWVEKILRGPGDLA
ncbi:NADPH-dependent FMN reductase [Allosphingosinicella sp.]|uniref:NADPH-dependent FMN reductase n=1 Tax=Allosphingosinicella sp. TaxID=2823234 RepID=UPI0037848EB9